MAEDIRTFEETNGITFQEWLQDGGLAGEFTKNYYKWNENPEAFYKTLTNPYYEIYEEWTTQEQNPKTLPAVNQEINRINQQAENKNVNKPGYFKIGTVELTIPPIQISVSDIKHNRQYKTLRTKSDIIFQSGKATKVIELDVYFHDIDSINNKLRPLLAQLKCVPFIPIYSDYLKTVLDPDTPYDKDKLVNEEGREIDTSREYREANNRIEKSRTALRERIRKNKHLMAFKPNFISDLNDYWNGELDPLNTTKLDSKKSLVDNIDHVLMEAGVAENRENEDTIRYQARETDTNTKDIKSFLNDQFNSIHPVRDEGNLVGVLSQVAVGTVAGFPESLACHITMFLFNYMPFSSRFEYLDENNDPTLDIDKCLYFVQWYASRFLEESNNEITQYFKPLDGQMNGDVQIYYTLDEQKQGPRVRTDNNSVCASITVVQRNSIAFLPVLQWSVPTCQYMGSHNSEVLITFDTIDNGFINELRDLFDQVEWRSRNNLKARRKNFVTIDNELLHLFGIRNCVLRKFDTNTVEGSPGVSRVTLSMTEFDINQLKHEKIKKVIQYSDDMAREFFRADLESYLENPNNVNEKFRKAIERDIMYKSAAGWGVTYSPGHLNKFIKQDNRLRDKVVNIIKDYGLNVVQGEEPITIKDNPRDEHGRWYNVTDMENVGQFIKDTILNTTDVNNLSNDMIDCVMWNSDYMDSYRRDVYDYVDSYLRGNSVNLPENVRARFEKEDITNEESRQIYVYPDMDLPDYIDTKRVGVGAPKPSYTRLGTRNPTLKQYESPRIDSDIVEPDFCFYYEALSDKTYLWNSEPLSFWEKMAQGIDMFFEDFIRVTQQEIPQYVRNARDYLQFTPMSALDVDDLLDDDAAKQKDKLIESEQAKAKANRDKIQTQSLTPTTPQEYYRFEKESRETKEYLIPENYTMYNSFKVTKKYSDQNENSENDSGINVYGGIMPDSSFYEELRDNGQSAAN